jgi:hypothetical protein
MINPIEKPYITVEPVLNIGLLLFLFVISHIYKFNYDENLDVLTSKTKTDLFDGEPFIVGLQFYFYLFFRIKIIFFLNLIF